MKPGRGVVTLEMKGTVSPAKWHVESEEKGKYIIDPKKNNRLFCELTIKAMEEIGQDKVNVGEIWRSKLKQSWIEQYPDRKLPDKILDQALEEYSKWISEMEKRYEKQRLVTHSW